MKVLLIGKTGVPGRWIEDMADDLRIGGHRVSVLSTRNQLFGARLRRMLLSPLIGAPLASRLVRLMSRLAPDLVLLIGSLDDVPLAVLEALSAAHGRPPLAAWIDGEVTDEAAAKARLLDLIAFTGSGSATARASLTSPPPSIVVPAGTSRGFRAAASQTTHLDRMAFVGAATETRRVLLAAVREPVSLFGADWGDAAGLGLHERVVRRVGARELSDIDARHAAILAIRASEAGDDVPGPRHFAPYVQGTPVATDARTDLDHCFDIGTEIIVWRDASELDELSRELRRDPARARAIGQAGRKRVLAHHTYTRRLEMIASALGVRAAAD
jgi:Glycosyl transferases group 1